MENKLLKNVLKGDKVIWSLFFGLLAFSMLAVYSSIGRSAIINSGSTPERAMLKHCVFIAISIFCAVVVSNTPYQLFRKLSLVVMLIGCAGLLYIIATHGERWIRIFGFSFQPSEFSKPALMVFLASMIDKHKDKLDSLQLFLQLLLIIFIVSGLNFKDDFSTTALYLMCSMMVLFYGKVNFKYWIRTILIVVVVAVALIIYSMNDYKHSVERSQLYTEAGVAVAQEESFGRIATIGHRMKDWLNPDTNDLNYKINRFSNYFSRAMDYYAFRITYDKDASAYDTLTSLLHEKFDIQYNPLNFYQSYTYYTYGALDKLCFPNDNLKIHQK